MAEKTTTTANMARLLGFTRQNLENIAKSGWVKPSAPNCWPIIATFQGVLKYARDEGRRSSKSATETRVSAARAREIELRTAQRAGELCELDEVMAFTDEVFGMLRADFSGLPAMVTRDLSIRRDIERGVNEILNRMSARLIAQGNALKADGEIASR
jgi:hypothetical protein